MKEPPKPLRSYTDALKGVGILLPITDPLFMRSPSVHGLLCTNVYHWNGEIEEYQGVSPNLGVIITISMIGFLMLKCMYNCDHKGTIVFMTKEARNILNPTIDKFKSIVPSNLVIVNGRYPVEGSSYPLLSVAAALRHAMTKSTQTSMR
eukprot:GHVR01024242.1.p1 GENE.GHVR01024242.1~~GHVR01024242.1.p1  ORF type:complete len:149 (-),score=2.40 GHVR01024242.1:288-734(-)